MSKYIGTTEMTPSLDAVWTRRYKIFTRQSQKGHSPLSLPKAYKWYGKRQGNIYHILLKLLRACKSISMQTVIKLRWILPVTWFNQIHFLEIFSALISKCWRGKRSERVLYEKFWWLWTTPEQIYHKNEYWQQICGTLLSNTDNTNTIIRQYLQRSARQYYLLTYYKNCHTSHAYGRTQFHTQANCVCHYYTEHTQAGRKYHLKLVTAFYNCILPMTMGLSSWRRKHSQN